MNQPLMPQQHGGQMQTRNLSQMLANLGPRSSLAAQSKVDPKSLAAGIKPAFASVTFKGKTWGIRHRGQTHPLLVRDPQTGQVLGGAPSIDIVILKSAVAISKAFYIEKYQENDNRQPDCWSTNGQVPDPAAPKKQSATCRGCQWDAFGSRITEDNRKGKACQDAKRLAVVPAADLKNEFFGGPMLLKLPPSAFAGFSELEAALLQQGYEYFSVVMRLTFDHQAAFPKIVFTPIGVLNDYQMQEVLNLQELDVVDRILSEELYEVSADPQQPPEPQQPQQVPQQVAQPQPIVPAGAPGQPGVIGSVGIAPGHQPQTAAPQAFNPVAPQPAHHPQPVAPYPAGMAPQAPPPPNADGMDIPAHLRAVPQGNGAAPPPAQAFTTMASGAPQTVVQGLQPQVAPTPQPVAPLQQAPSPANPVAAVETPEQKIARLEAELKAAQQKAPRKRTKPVTPAGNQGVTVVQPSPVAPLTTAPSTQPSAGVEQRISQELQAAGAGTPIVGADDDADGDAPADLDSRIDALMGSVQS